MGIVNWFKDYLADIWKSLKDFVRNVALTSPFWVILCSLVLMVSMGLMIGSQINDRYDQNMAKFWQNNSKTSYRYMSVFAKSNCSGTTPQFFVSEEESFNVDSIDQIRENLKNKIGEAQHKQDSGKKKDTKNSSKKKSGDSKKESSATNWTDCYSTCFKTTGSYLYTVETMSGTNEKYVSFDADVVALEGNYTVFHPFEYLSGGFLPTSIENQNIVVINKHLAWYLFKSYNVVGRTIYLWGEEFTISGVVREGDSSIDELAGASENRVFCYFRKVENINKSGFFGGGANDEEGFGGSDIAVTCYEVMLPEIVKGVAKSDLIASLPSYNASEPKFQIVSNTGRYAISSVYDYNMPIGESDKDEKGFDFPYWEKAARLTSERIFIEGGIFIFGIILLVIGIILIVLRVNRNIGVREPKIEFEDIVE